MGFKCGIVGLPNVGKSTLFNALTNTAAAAAENYPFCTIEPNVGRVPVPEPRLAALREIAGSERSIETYLSIVDIAGLVRGASKGEGLGNRFLSNIREVDAIIHILRCFEDDDVTHVDGRVDPESDADAVKTELLLADLERIERRLAAAIKKARGGENEAKTSQAVLEALLALLSDGKPAQMFEPGDAEQQRIFDELQFLTAKPILYVANVDEASAAEGNVFSQQVAAIAKQDGALAIVISAAVEAEIAQFQNQSERQEFLETMGLHETGLDRVIKAGYDLLDQITFFTVGPKEARAWTVRRGAKAPEAAGVIHTDFQKGFIRAEKISYGDYMAAGGEQGAKEAGKMSLEGKDYEVKDGDVLYFRFTS